jgi:hypothetical protein|tara:strand:- start:21 stop:218 length:198 start_codon:yes stop_codon:yes gene_type:complete
MLKVGDRVFPIMNMGATGIIIDVKLVESNQWMIGGAASKIRKLVVKHDDNQVFEYTSNDLMRLDD